jgi:hypothetical protein
MGDCGSEGRLTVQGAPGKGIQMPWAEKSVAAYQILKGPGFQCSASSSYLTDFFKDLSNFTE